MKTLHRFSVSTAALLVGLGTMPALAQQATTNTQSSDAGNVVQGDISAENSIEQGLKSGQLTSEEAARLEAHQARIDQIESRDLHDGQLSTNEQNRIDSAELTEGSRIVALDNNGVTANPDSQASTRMANDVQRNVNQQNRILRNTENGNLTDTQVGTHEHGQARVDGIDAKASANNVVDYSEQNRIRTAENGQSANIYDDAHGNVTGQQGTGDNGQSDTQRKRVNHVRANSDGSLTTLDSNGKGDRDHDRMADRDNSNGKSWDRNNKDDSGRLSDNHDRDRYKDRFDRDDHKTVQNGDLNNSDHDLNKDLHDRDDRMNTAQNGNTGNQDQDSRFQKLNGERDMDGDHGQMTNQSSSQPSTTNDSASVNTNGRSANTNGGTSSTTNNSMSANTDNNAATNPNSSVSTHTNNGAGIAKAT